MVIRRDSINEIWSQLPPELHKIIRHFYTSGFRFTLVGGAVRDYLQNQVLPSDLDFELRHIDLIEDDDWKNTVEKCVGELVSHFSLKVSQQPYLVYKFKIRHFDIELASPRLEVFEKKASVGHSNFKAHYISNLSYSESFCRRDFTVNAIGVEFSFDNKKEVSVDIIDPLGGFESLMEHELRPCGDHFYRDPVRFMRAQRFKESLTMTFSHTLELQFSKMNLSELTRHYFISELLKGPFFPILNSFYSYAEQFGLEVPLPFRCLENIVGHCDDRNSHGHLRVTYFYLRYNKLITSKNETSIKSLLQLRKNDYHNVDRFAEGLSELVDVSVRRIFIDAPTWEIENLANQKELKIVEQLYPCRDLYEQLIPFLKEWLAIDDFVKLRKFYEEFPVELSTIEEKKEWQKEWPVERRSIIPFYCHIIAKAKKFGQST